MIKFRKIEQGTEGKRKEPLAKKAAPPKKKLKKPKAREIKDAKIRDLNAAGLRLSKDDSLGKVRVTKIKRTDSKDMKGGPNRMLTSADYETK